MAGGTSDDTAPSDAGRSARTDLHDRDAIVDCHAHAVPTTMLEMLADRADGLHGFTAHHIDRGWLVEVPGGRGPLTVPATMTDRQLREKWCADQGITVQVLSAWMDVHATAQMPAEAARDWSRRLNAHMLESARADRREQPVLATVMVHDPEVAAEDLRRAVSGDGMDGLILSTNPAGVADLAAGELDALWAAAEELGAPVMLHPPTDGPSSRMPGVHGFGNVHGRLIDTTLAASRLLLSGVLDRHPRLRLVLVHGGGFLPFQADRLDGGRRLPPLNQTELEREHPSDYLKDLYFDTVALSGRSIAFLDSLVGSSQLLLGTDYPFPLGGSDPVGAVYDAGLDPGRSQAVLGGNASSLLSRRVHA